VDLLRTPKNISFLGGLIQREIIYRIGAHQPEVLSNKLLMLIGGGVLDSRHSRKAGCRESYRQSGRSPDRFDGDRLTGSYDR
jgi:hypothetical protein